MKLPLRFKIRTLLICTAIASVLLGLQVQTSIKARRFEVALRNPSGTTKRELMSDAVERDEHSTFFWGPVDANGGKVSMVPPTVVDILRFRRRINFRFATIFEGEGGSRTTTYFHRYEIFSFGQSCDSRVVEKTVESVRPPVQ